MISRPLAWKKFGSGVYPRNDHWTGRWADLNSAAAIRQRWRRQLSVMRRCRWRRRWRHGNARLVQRCRNWKIARAGQLHVIAAALDTRTHTVQPRCNHSREAAPWVLAVHVTYRSKTSTKGTMDPEGSARNSCNSWPLYARRADQRACFG